MIVFNEVKSVRFGSTYVRKSFDSLGFKLVVPKPKLHNTDEETVATHGNQSLKLTYLYKVQYKDGSHPKYKPFVLEDQFWPKFQLPPGVNPIVAAMSNLSLPDLIIDVIVLQSNNYTLARTKVEKYELVDGAFKKNLCWI